MLEFHQFLDVLGLGAAHALSNYIKVIQAAASSSSVEEELTLLDEALQAVDTLASYKHTFSFPFPVGTLDAFMSQFIGKMDAQKKMYYAALSLLWRADLASVKSLLTKRRELLR